MSRRVTADARFGVRQKSTCAWKCSGAGLTAFTDLRTIFQTVSLADDLEIEFTPGRKTGVLARFDDRDRGQSRAACGDGCHRGYKCEGFWTRFALKERIPMGGGLGGGSSDAAPAVLLALPILTGRHLPWEKLIEIGASLGSDVPFFLMGGAALGLGRGTELYPLDFRVKTRALLVTPGIHVSTPEAFRALGRSLTWGSSSPGYEYFATCCLGYKWGAGSRGLVRSLQQ